MRQSPRRREDRKSTTRVATVCSIWSDTLKKAWQAGKRYASPSRPPSQICVRRPPGGASQPALALNFFRLLLSAVLCGLVLLRANDTSSASRAPANLPADRSVAPASTATDGSRIVNSSVRARAGSGDAALIAGFVISGDAPKSMLVRGVGPTLASMGVIGALPDPTLEIHDLQSGRVLGVDCGWQTASDPTAITRTSSSVGGFPFAVGSLDSALLARLSSGVYTANVFGRAAAGGVALLEVYDADALGTGKLVNLSARTQVGTGDDILILGFVISGKQPKRVLIRGIGPTLVAQGVAGALVDPQLELRDGQGRLVASNDNWAGSPAIAAVASKVGAFPLDAASKDACLVTTLAPGVYTAQVTGVNSTTGVALVELYDVPEPTTRWTMVNVSPNGQQADCHVIEFPDGRIALVDVADAADAGGAALAYLRAHNITAVDLVVLSHFHRDHFGRLSDIMEAGIKVRRVAYNMPAAGAVLTEAEVPWGFSRAEAESLLQYLKNKGVSVFTPRAGERLIDVPLGDGTSASLDAVCLFDGLNSPVGLTDTNDTSILLRLSHGKTRALFTGDLNSALGTWLANSNIDLAADLLKVPHHGTDGCAPDAFFDRVNAKVALVPSPTGLWLSPRSSRIHAYFANRQIPTYVSGLNGHVTVTIDAAGYSIATQ